MLFDDMHVTGRWLTCILMTAAEVETVTELILKMESGMFYDILDKAGKRVANAFDANEKFGMAKGRLQMKTAIQYRVDRQLDNIISALSAEGESNE